MEDVLQQSFAPRVMVVASAECVSLYDHPLLRAAEAVTSSDKSVRLITLPQLAANKSHDQLGEEPDVEALIRALKASQVPDFYHSVVSSLVQATLAPQSAQAFETFGHPVACILAVSSANPSPISALTQLYQQSYHDCPQGMSADFLRCVWYIHSDSESDERETTEDFPTVASQFGPHCFELANAGSAVEGAVRTLMEESVYPYLQRLVKEWQLTNGNRSAQNAFGFAKILKKLVASGPPRPENNLFFDVCREMQPHVASIPARRRSGSSSNSSVVDIEMQVRRLADVAFMLKDYKLAYAAYESLRKPFSSEQRWAQFGGCSEMVAISGTLCHMGDSGAAVDTALYNYNARLRLPVHALRCVLVVSGCLVESGDQLLAAGLLSTTLMEVDPYLGSGDEPAETAMLMERIALAFEKRQWFRKSKLWTMLAQREWARVAAAS